MTDRADSDFTAQPISSDYRPSRWMQVLLTFAPNIRIGDLTMVLPDGCVHRFHGQEPGPAGVVHIHRDRFARRLMIGGKLGFCESYLDGDWSSPDTPVLFEMALRNEAVLDAVLRGRSLSRWLSRLAHALRPNSRKGSRRNIARHYDLGNSFYSRWLDPSMTYSAALFDDVSRPEEMSVAQDRKYAEIARRAGLTPGNHLLEIGCGWGGFAEYAGRQGAKVTAITISREQHAFASRRIQQAGLAEKVEIRLQDYRDTSEQFDGVASIEMFEAVGEKYWPTYFRTVRDRLKPGGQAALQVITIEERSYEDYRSSPDYIQRYIFPGGMLPSNSVLKQQVENSGLRWLESEGFGAHYARTLRWWQDRFQASWTDLRAMGFDERFKRMWEQYLWYCEAGFSVGTIDLLQLSARRD